MVRLGADGRTRCDWGSAWSDPPYLAYHDQEWGVPLRDKRRCSSCSAWKAPRPACRGRRSCTEGTATGGRSRASTPTRSPGSAKPTSTGCWPIRGSCAIGPRSPPPSAMRARSLPCGRAARGSSTTCGRSSTAGRSSTGVKRRPTRPHRRQNQPRLSRDLRRRGFRIRRADDLLRLHAVGRPRERPPRRLLPLGRGKCHRRLTFGPCHGPGA